MAMTAESSRLRVLRALIVALPVLVLANDDAIAAEPEPGPAVLDARESAIAELDFRSGLSAYRSGEYNRAFSHWLAWSIRGHAKSQAALAYLYLRGLGVPKDRLVAAQWYERAAQQGVPLAQFFLGSILFEGRGVERDIVGAHMWCDLAVSSGFEPAMACRQEIARSMTVAQLREAQRRVVEWRKAKGR